MIRIWDARTGQQLRSFRAHAKHARSVAFSPDGRRLASGGWDGTVKVWDAQTGGLMVQRKGPGGRIGRVAFSPDGKRLAAGSSAGGGLGMTGADGPGVLQIWDATLGESLRTIRGHDGGSSGWPSAPTAAAWPPSAGRQGGEGLGRGDRPGGAYLPRAQPADLVRGVQPRRRTDRLGQRGLRPTGRRRTEGLGCADRPGAVHPRRTHRRGPQRDVQPGRPASGHRGLRRDREALGRPDRPGSPRPARPSRRGPECGVQPRRPPARHVQR